MQIMVEKNTERERDIQTRYYFLISFQSSKASVTFFLRIKEEEKNGIICIQFCYIFLRITF